MPSSRNGVDVIEDVIDVERLVKRLRRAPRDAVACLSFGVGPGEFFALLGPNGAGKTTIVSILATTLAPTSGGVRIAGVDARRQIGGMFQNPSRDMNLSGEENVRLHAILYGLYPYRPSYRVMPAAYRRQISDMAAVLALESDMFRPVRQLSGGTRRKLEIMRGLMHRPRLLFLDEPTAGLDVASRRGLWAYLAEIRQRHRTTTVLTTHDLAQAEAADRIPLLNRGEVAAQGSPAHLTAQLGGAWLEIDAADRAALRRELIRPAVRFDENGPFRISREGRSAHELARSLATTLTVMRTRQASLEDVCPRLLADE